MSFRNKNFWTPRDAERVADGEMGCDGPSRTEPKRTHNWILNASEHEFFSTKKQAIEAAETRAMPEISNPGISLWDDTTPNFQPVLNQCNLFGTDLVKAFNLGGGNVSNTERKRFGNNSLVSLSMPHAMGGPSHLNLGAQKPKGSIFSHYNRIDNASVFVGPTLNRCCNHSSISLGQNYNNGDGRSISVGPIFSNRDENFIAMGQARTFNKENGNNFMLMGHDYSLVDDRVLFMSSPSDKANGKFVSLTQSHEKGDNTNSSSFPTYSKGNEKTIAIAPTYHNTMNRNTIPTFLTSDIISVCPTHDKANAPIAAYDKDDSAILSTGQNHSKNGIEGNGSSGRVISNYELLMSQSSVQAPEAPARRELVRHNVDPITSLASGVSTGSVGVTKNKEQKIPKKLPPNNFPSNVKSLLSTGILDGVPVKYVSWSREKDLRGIIKGTGYLCGCTDCKLSKILNAYDFEKHAGCKTKHPNNHIYFENGKTIYAVVIELKNTPLEMLFDNIQNVTGSPINQNNFNTWKESYIAASRELQRIYGKEEVTLPS